MIEVWKDIEEFKGRYLVSNLGNVKSVVEKKTHKQERFLTKTISNGYELVHIMFNGKRFARRVHRLVAEAFIENPENKKEVDHLDTNPLNNCVSNLRWVTRKENQNNPKTKIHLSNSKQGNKNPMCGVVQTELLNQLHAQRRKAVNQLTLGGEKINTFVSATEAEKITGVNASTIGAVCNGKRKTAGNYLWEFVS